MGGYDRASTRGGWGYGREWFFTKNVSTTVRVYSCVRASVCCVLAAKSTFNLLTTCYRNCLGFYYICMRQSARAHTHTTHTHRTSRGCCAFASEKKPPA